MDKEAKRPLKMFPMGAQTVIPLTHQLMDYPSWKELPGLLLLVPLHHCPVPLSWGGWNCGSHALSCLGYTPSTVCSAGHTATHIVIQHYDTPLEHVGKLCLDRGIKVSWLHCSAMHRLRCDGPWMPTSTAHWCRRKQVSITFPTDGWYFNFIWLGEYRYFQWLIFSHRWN